jgi:hypothetical protein
MEHGPPASGPAWIGAFGAGGLNWTRRAARKATTKREGNSRSMKNALRKREENGGKLWRDNILRKRRDYSTLDLYRNIPVVRST